MILTWRWAGKAVQAMGARGFDTSTDEGRSRERYRRVLLTGSSSGLTQAISILTLLVSVPLALRYLGTERYGLWMTLTSLVALLGFADLGLGNGLLSAISDANGRDDLQAARRYVSTSAVMLSSLAVLLALLLGLIYASVPWRLLLNLSSAQAVSEAGPAAAILVGCFLIGIPMGIVQRIQMGYQEGFASLPWVGLGAVIALTGLVASIHYHAGLPWLVLAVSGAPVVASTLNAIVLFRNRRPWLRPRLHDTSLVAAKRLLSTSFLFFMLQLAATVGYQSDNVIVARILGAGQVPQYAVPFRLLMFPPLILGLVLTPLWPAYAEAIARRDQGWVVKTLRRSIVLSLVVSVPLSAVLVVAGVPIIHLWAGPLINPSMSLLIGLATWAVLLSLSSALSMFLNAARAFRFLVVAAVSMMLANLVLSIMLTRALGISGVVWGSVIAQGVFVLIPSIWVVPRLLEEVRRNPNKRPEQALASVGPAG
jgi:O-antigen/teichoic acid export membrane protein